MRAALLLFSILSMIGMNGYTDIRSTSGNIDFDLQSDGTLDFTMSSEGFAVGSSTAQANLHVTGNSQISAELGVGTTNPQHTLDIKGSIALGTESVSANTQLSGNSLVFVDTTPIGNVIVTLPNPSSIEGRKYTIKKISSGNSLHVMGPLDELEAVELTTTTVGFPFLGLESAANTWRITSISPGASVTPLVASANLVGYWKLDDSSGNTAIDSSGNANNGTLTGGFSFTANHTDGTRHRALDFDGSNDQIGITKLNLGTVHSISFWIRSDGYGTSTSHCVLGDASQQSHIQFNSSNRLDYHLGGGNDTRHHSTGADAGGWINFILVRNGLTVTLYKNGSKFSTDTLDTDVILNVSTLGSRNGQRYVDGDLDEIRIYDKILSTHEIETIYHAGR